MIETLWPYLAIMLVAAGLFPSLEKRYRWRFFSILPPIVLTYLFVTALAVGGVWSPTGEVQSAQRVLTAHLLPTLLFLLMVTCDLRAILKVGPRVLLVYACAMGSILLAIVVVYALFRGVLPQDTLALLREERGGYVEIDMSSSMPWDKLRERIRTHGMRNSNCIAIAPTATISNIIGVGASIEPEFQNIYVKSNLSGEFTVVNEHLVAELKRLNLWDEVLVADLKFFDGSLDGV